MLWCFSYSQSRRSSSDFLQWRVRSLGDSTKKSDGIDGPCSNAFLHAIEQACAAAMMRAFGDVGDEKIKQVLAQGFSAGVDWCCSEQFDADVAKAALAIGLAPEEAATGAVRKTG